jgi:hypothetical protein
MPFRRSRQPKPWRSAEQRLQRSYNGRKDTLIKMIMAINKLPDTRFGLYGERNGKWLKFEPDENFSHDTGATVRVHESFGPGYKTPIPPPLSQEMPSSASFRPDDLINLTGDIFDDA